MRDDHIGVSEPRSGRAIAGYFDGHIAQSHQVMLAVTHDMLQIRSTDGVIATAWPLAGIAVTGRADDAVSLRCRREVGRLMVPGSTFSQLLKPHLTPGSGLRRWGVVAIGCLILLLVALLVEMLPNLILPAVPASWDYRLGRVTEATLLAHHPRCTGETGQQALDAFVDRGIFAFLSDHPSAADRVAHLREPANGQPAFTALEWLAIRDMCAPTSLTMRTEPGHGAG